MFKIGFVYKWEDDVVYVAITNENYIPSFGDLLYTVEKTERGTRWILMEVIGMGGETPSKTQPVESFGALEALEVKKYARAKLFIEILEEENKTIIVKASKPPQLLSPPVYLIRIDNPESEGIMKKISEYSGGGSSGKVGIVVLRSGVAHHPKLAQERYFMNAEFKVDIKSLLKKHVLIIGQTGAGKTSGIQGILVKYALDSAEKVGWLVIDRHGEYTPPEGYAPDKFISTYVDAIKLNHSLSDNVRVYTYRLISRASKKSNKPSTIPGVYDIAEGPVRASSISFTDFVALEEIDLEKASLLEEFISVVIDIIRQSAYTSETKIGETLGITPEGEIERVNMNTLALIPLLADNLVRYEGVGLSRDHKRGLHKILVDRGIDARLTRILRRLVLSLMNWKTRTVLVDDKSVVVLDDSRSVVKVSPTLTDPKKLVCLLDAIVKGLEKMNMLQGSEKDSYPWRKLCKEQCKETFEIEPDAGIDLNEVVNRVNRGDTVFLDVSNIPGVQADLVSITIVRKIFESRLMEGVEASATKPVVAIVSEEAPLYLSPERVKSPYNPFARIAREGRKFGIGLVAITQLATMIEKQLLGNFNTLIVMRTKSRGDIEFLRDIGVPVETLPYLGDREAFIYTPDLPIKEPIPVYVPAWFDEKYQNAIKNKKSELSSGLKVSEGTKKLFEEI